jgi:hypothetical protein
MLQNLNVHQYSTQTNFITNLLVPNTNKILISFIWDLPEDINDDPNNLKVVVNLQHFAEIDHFVKSMFFDQLLAENFNKYTLRYRVYDYIAKYENWRQVHFITY